MKRKIIKLSCNLIPVSKWRKKTRGNLLKSDINKKLIKTDLGKYICNNLLLNKEKGNISGFLNSNILISSKKKYLYGKVYKNACTRVYTSLIKDLSKDSVKPKIHKVKWYEEVEKDIKIEDNIEKIIKDPNFFKFTFVRNPYDRLFSAWKNKIYDSPKPDVCINYKKRFDKSGGEVSFEKFINVLYEKKDDFSSFDYHWIPQNLSSLYSFIEYDFIGKLENFNKDFAYVLKKIKADPKIFDDITEKINETKKLNLTDFYTKDLQEKVYEMYKKDFELFGYSKELLTE